MIIKNIKFLILLLFSLILITLEYKHNSILDNTKKTINIKIRYPKYFLQKISHKYKNIKNILTKNSKLKTEIEELYYINNKLMAQLSLNKEQKKENETLRKLLNANKKQLSNIHIVKIIERKHDHNGITIVAENSNKLCVNCIAFTENGLIGKIDSIINNKILITTIFNKNFRIPIITEKNNEQGILIGGKTPKIEYIEENAIILDGEGILTHPIDNIITEKIFIGTIKTKNNKYTINTTQENIKKYQFVAILVPEN